MRGPEFQRWASHGLRDYGEDPWQFLRELAQNSRDAGARSIRVSVSSDGVSETLLHNGAWLVMPGGTLW